MKATTFLFSLLAAVAAAEEPRTIELSNGTAVEVLDGKVSLKSGDAPGNGSSSVSQSSHTDSTGTTITRISTERNGRKAECTITISPKGEVSIDDGGTFKPEPQEKPAAEAKGGWLGVHTVPIPKALRAQLDLPENQGILLEFLAPGGPAAQAGLQENDILLTLDGTPISSVEEFRKKLSEAQPGLQAILTCLRKGQQETVSATLGKKPAESAPGKAANNEAARLEKENRGGSSSSGRAVIIDGEGQTRIVESSGDDAFELLLKDPNVPESMKEQIRRSRDQLRKIQEPDQSKKED
jgi:membrane-associated protease RseP (regulator of RpoE activity)